MIVLDSSSLSFIRAKARLRADVHQEHVADPEAIPHARAVELIATRQHPTQHAQQLDAAARQEKRHPMTCRGAEEPGAETAGPQLRALAAAAPHGIGALEKAFNSCLTHIYI